MQIVSGEHQMEKERDQVADASVRGALKITLRAWLYPEDRKMGKKHTWGILVQ